MNQVLELIEQYEKAPTNKFLDFFNLDKSLVFFGAGEFSEYVLSVYDKPHIRHFKIFFQLFNCSARSITICVM